MVRELLYKRHQVTIVTRGQDVEFGDRVNIVKGEGE
jgi:hypothetical protein